jgi:hypothetical protein
MFFEDPGKRYPNLVQALNTLARRRFDDQTDPAAPSVGLIGFLTAGIAFMITGSALAGLLLVTVAIAASVTIGKARRKPKAPVNERAKEATEVAKGMGLMLTKRRLHRDLDEGSLVLLEECARHWLRAKAALHAPFWTGSQVPLHYQAVRAQALEALDDSMDDVLLHYRGFIPEHVENRHAMDYVDEALETFVAPGRKKGYYPPPVFNPVREIGEKLRELGDEAERMANQAQLDPEVAAMSAPGRSLDETLNGLREIRQAEEELRQNLRG